MIPDDCIEVIIGLIGFFVLMIEASARDHFKPISMVPFEGQSRRHHSDSVGGAFEGLTIVHLWLRYYCSWNLFGTMPCDT